MRLALLYPPPWKIADPGANADYGDDGRPDDYVDGDLDADFFQTPYGLFSLAAQALRAGHQVRVLNLSGFDWPKVERVVQTLDAQVFGMSCWTANRRGVALVAREIRRRHPNAHIVIGGPHASPLAREMLEHHAEIDTVAVGEAEHTLLELIERLESGKPAAGVPGTFFRKDGGVLEAPNRPAIEGLDELACPHTYFGTHIVMTSRGCPWACTFCGAETTWGRGFRGQSVPYVLDAIESALARVPVRMLQIKDDTFTANKKRALEICRGIRERKLRFLWSCDTRVDVLTEELVREMRLAGCQRMSLGVESGSAKILRAINKKITPEKIIEATRIAKKFGVQVRYYMMLGNRGETAATFRETLEFLERARPHQYLFSCLSIYPGTQDFHDAERSGRISREDYFTGRFQELMMPFDASDEDTQLMNDWFSKNSGLRHHFEESVDDCLRILDDLGQHAPAVLDLAGAHYRAGDLGRAEEQALRALALGHPTPGVIYNYLACIAFARGDITGMQDHFMTAAKTDPQHAVLIENVERARKWFRERGPERGIPLQLRAQHAFQLFERTEQPTLPGPLPADYDRWDPPLVRTRLHTELGQAAVEGASRRVLPVL